MAGYAKVFSDIIYSTVWREDVYTKIIWITMLVMADRHGLVMSSIPGLADAAKVSLDQCLSAIEVLSSPDKYSRTKEFDGRRISEVDGGWLLLNYEKFRSRKDDEEQRIRTAERVRRHRQKLADSIKTDSVTSNASVTRRNPIAEADTDADTNAESEATAVKEKTKATPSPKRKPASDGQEKDFNLEPDIATPEQLTWAAYRDAYARRYKTDPVRNAKINGQIKQLVKRLGKEAPDVAAFYLTHNARFYVEKCHAIGNLLADAEKLRTEWATGRKITNTSAQQADKSQSNQDLIAEARAHFGGKP
jgi:hypothetical protein